MAMHLRVGLKTVLEFKSANANITRPVTDVIHVRLCITTSHGLPARCLAPTPVRHANAMVTQAAAITTLHWTRIPLR